MSAHEHTPDLSPEAAAKRTLRELVRARLAALDCAFRATAGRAALERLAAAPEFQRADTVLAYDSDATEVDTAPLVALCLAQGKRLCLPRTVKQERRLTARLVTDCARDLERSRFGFREPKQETPEVPVEELGLIVVPGVAFDAACHRLGRGAGYYDRFLAAPGLRAALCALALECQLVDVVPCSAHDLPVHAVFTESRVVRGRTPF